MMKIMKNIMIFHKIMGTYISFISNKIKRLIIIIVLNLRKLFLKIFYLFFIWLLFV